MAKRRRTDILLYSCNDNGSTVVYAPYEGKYRSRRRSAVPPVTQPTPAQYEAAKQSEKSS